MANEFDSPLGEWRTKIQIDGGSWISHGVMTFSEDGKVGYTLRNGRIFFNEKDGKGKWKGHWVEDKQPWVVCDEKLDGSTAWGEAIFQFDDEFKTFRGTWDKCGDGKRNIWQGYRL
ncbi:MAG: hypothetical protein AAF434_09550 [Pseudomonadota bacterium]